ncbi:DUF2935 domain-containing protein [Clostridium sp. YIM B02505]|uniref:DUF2935 domain-containing protein n=1 Tax=Clostridium yunnanense TaxID=2800325 RepID=A0ABS1EJV0_9CLOT|nr:DUF2935 domain-containing protein [Clostridium yunnanense]MBK1809637.1 DUF2935 domain-containing protein [Clostridium yunnanense]
MISDREYIIHSLEFNLFFLRIAREHTIFVSASLPLKNLSTMRQANVFKKAYEDLLSRVILLSSSEQVGNRLINSGEFITEFTLEAEKITSQLTGIPIETNITKQEINIFGSVLPKSRQDNILAQISAVNDEAIRLTTSVIAFQTKLLNDILSCKAFSYTYPLMLDHVTREAQFAVMTLRKLQMKDTIDTLNEIINFEINWTRLMDEHSKFIRGYLDPSETALFETADGFANDLDKLLASTLALEDSPEDLARVTRETINQVTKLRDFKKQGTAGILACKIKSIIPPLLSDHVLREANYYLKLLKTFKQ